MGRGEGGLLSLKLKFLGLLQNSETWLKEDGGEAVPGRHESVNAGYKYTVVPAVLRNQHWVMGQSERLHSGDGVGPGPQGRIRF